MIVILYVEDHAPAQLLMAAIVADLTPYTLISATTGAEAELLTREYRPDAYILDLDLPDTDGITLARQLNAIHAAPTILVSAYAESIQPDASLIYAYLAKPLDPDDVAQTLRLAVQL